MALIPLLNSFQEIGLEEMDRVSLMDRTDTKFVLTYEEFLCVLHEIQAHYAVLSVNNKKISAYKTLYYDTNDKLLYHKHHNGELNRYKVRHRTYLESNTGYLEVKFKSNKGRTQKQRVKQIAVPFTWDDTSAEFLATHTPFAPSDLIPALWVNYNRLTLVSKSDAERVTVDLNLSFEANEQRRDLNHMIIIEVKRDKKSNSPFIQALRKRFIREGSLSKYCLGVMMMYRGVKKNNFKSKLSIFKHLISYGQLSMVP